MRRALLDRMDGDDAMVMFPCGGSCVVVAKKMLLVFVFLSPFDGKQLARYVLPRGTILLADFVEARC